MMTFVIEPWLYWSGDTCRLNTSVPRVFVQWRLLTYLFACFSSRIIGIALCVGNGVKVAAIRKNGAASSDGELRSTARTKILKFQRNFPPFTQFYLNAPPFLNLSPASLPMTFLRGKDFYLYWNSNSVGELISQREAPA